MRKHMIALVALVAGPFAATAMAQTLTPATPPAAAVPATGNKAKQEVVKSATEAQTRSKGVEAAEGSAKAKTTKGTPKSLPDKAAKHEAIKSATASSAKGWNIKAAEGSAAAKADKSPKRPKPKMGEHEKELKKAATP